MTSTGPNEGGFAQERPDFPGSIGIERIQRGVLVRVHHTELQYTYLYLVLDEPHTSSRTNYRGLWVSAIMVFEDGSLGYEQRQLCELSLADIGVVPYENRGWNPSNYTTLEGEMPVEELENPSVGND